MLRLDFPSGSEFRSLKCAICDKMPEIALRDTTKAGEKEIHKRILLLCNSCMIDVKAALNKR